VSDPQKKEAAKSGVCPIDFDTVVPCAVAALAGGQPLHEWVRHAGQGTLASDDARVPAILAALPGERRLPVLPEGRVAERN